MEICPKVDRVAGKVPHTHTHTQHMGSGLQDREEEELAENKPNRPKYQIDQEER